MQECQNTDLRDDECDPTDKNVYNGNIKHKRSTKVAFGEIQY